MENQEDKASKKKRIGKPKAISIAILLAVAIGAYNSYQLHAIGGGTPFAGSSLFNISPSFALGSNPAGASITPGSSLNFTLSVQSAISHTIQLSFNSSYTAWSANAVNTCTPTTSYPGLLTMTLAGVTPVPPINYAGPAICGTTTFNPSQIVTVNMVPGLNTYKGTISVATNAGANIAFSLNFFGQVV
jgi:hypothetical protein